MKTLFERYNELDIDTDTVGKKEKRLWIPFRKNWASHPWKPLMPM